MVFLSIHLDINKCRKKFIVKNDNSINTIMMLIKKISINKYYRYLKSRILSQIKNMYFTKNCFFKKKHNLLMFYPTK